MIIKSLYYRSNFIFHATDPTTNEIVDFDEFFDRLQIGGGGQTKEAELLSKLETICNVEKITVSSIINTTL